jgi:hypothetical protein
MKKDRRMHTPYHGLGQVVLMLSLMGGATGTPLVQAAPACAKAEEVSAQHMLGLWRVHENAPTESNTPHKPVPTALNLTLFPHPEHQGSLSGFLVRDERKIAVVADIDEGEFTMEESQDGQRISASWTGTLTSRGCALEIEAERTAGSAPQGQRFILKKMGSP